MAALHIAAFGLSLEGCIGARLGRGVAELQPIGEADHSYLWWWRRGEPRAVSSYLYESTATQWISLKDVCEAKDDPDAYKRVAFVQFLTAEEGDVNKIRLGEPNMPYLGGWRPKAKPDRPDEPMIPPPRDPPPDPPDVTMQPPSDPPGPPDHPGRPGGAAQAVTPRSPPRRPQPAAPNDEMPVPIDISTPPESPHSGGSARSRGSQRGVWPVPKPAPPTPPVPPAP